MPRFVLASGVSVFSVGLVVASLASAETVKQSKGGTLSKPPAVMQKSPSTFVPGTGTCIDYVSDDFEEERWEFVHKAPKSSREQDKQERAPLGRSTNDRWHEGPERGEPDRLEIVATPKGGLKGSAHALMMRTLHSGIPGLNTYDVQQDDLIANCVMRLNGGIPVSERPSVVVRVYLPPVEQWERRSGPQFGFRSSVSTIAAGKSKGFFGGSDSEVEPYWPGMWVHFRAAGQRGAKEDSAYITVRSNKMGWDFPAKEIEQFGWWTFGLAFSSDGMVHYYASPGVDNLTSADYITSQYPYGYQAQQFRTYFFDVCNRNDGQTWSTPFVIDDPKLYLGEPWRVQSLIQAKEEQIARAAARKEEMAKQMAARKEEQAKRMAARQEMMQRNAAARSSQRSRRTR
jgi:hypothetical protein